jgi:hypothetical protein
MGTGFQQVYSDAVRGKITAESAEDTEGRRGCR